MAGNMNDDSRIYQHEWKPFPIFPQTPQGRLCFAGYVAFWLAIWGMIRGFWMNELAYIGPIPYTVFWFYGWAILQIVFLSCTYLFRFAQWGHELDRKQVEDPEFFSLPERDPSIFADAGLGDFIPKQDRTE